VIEVDETATFTIASTDAEGRGRDGKVEAINRLSPGRTDTKRVTQRQGFRAFVEIIPGRTALPQQRAVGTNTSTASAGVCKGRRYMHVKVIAIDIRSGSSSAGQQAMRRNGHRREREIAIRGKVEVARPGSRDCSGQSPDEPCYDRRSPQRANGLS